MQGDTLQDSQVVELPRPLFMDIASRLHYLHRHLLGPVFHGDLKDVNVLVSSDCQMLLSDFSLSTFQKPTFSMTVVNPRGGLYSWLAPELLDDYTPSTEGDMWAFRIVILIHGGKYVMVVPGAIDYVEQLYITQNHVIFDLLPAALNDLIESCYDQLG
ncbi:kinase-like domain-containing protein [Pisolithus marmoratus]|nr:kinase-like domain-containing protein [Pisolithus marmoratus]